MHNYCRNNTFCFPIPTWWISQEKLKWKTWHVYIFLYRFLWLSRYIVEAVHSPSSTVFNILFIYFLIFSPFPRLIWYILKETYLINYLLIFFCRFLNNTYSSSFNSNSVGPFLLSALYLSYDIFSLFS